MVEGEGNGARMNTDIHGWAESGRTEGRRISAAVDPGVAVEGVFVL